MGNTDSFVTGKRCLITGATDGIGKVTAEALAGKGAEVVLVGRNQVKTKKTLDEIQERTQTSDIEYLIADLSNQDEIHRLVKDYKHRYDTLDVLINNAGAIFTSRQETEDGLEMTFALNHLGYFLLTNLLLDVIEQSTPARIINVASEAHRRSIIEFDDLQSEDNYAPRKVYGMSKLANILFTYELHRRLKNQDITVNTLHPGFVASNFGKNTGFFGKILMSVLHLFARSPEKGAETIIYLASSRKVDGVSGKYFIDKKPAHSSDISYDQDIAKRLWTVSETLTGLD